MYSKVLVARECWWFSASFAPLDVFRGFERVILLIEAHSAVGILYPAGPCRALVKSIGPRLPHYLIGVTKPGALFVATGQAQRSGQREPEK
jgi:hypothetical protein